MLVEKGNAAIEPIMRFMGAEPNVLRVQGVFAQEDAPASAWPAIRQQLDELAAWVGADGVELPALPSVWR